MFHVEELDSLWPLIDHVSPAVTITVRQQSGSSNVYCLQHLLVEHTHCSSCTFDRGRDKRVSICIQISFPSVSAMSLVALSLVLGIHGNLNGFLTFPAPDFHKSPLLAWPLPL